MQSFRPCAGAEEEQRQHGGARLRAELQDRRVRHAGHCRARSAFRGWNIAAADADRRVVRDHQAEVSERRDIAREHC